MTLPPAEAAVAGRAVPVDAAVVRRSGLVQELAWVVRPLLVSRLLVWLVGVGAVLVFGVGGAQWSLDPNNISMSFGRVGNLLVAPSIRWDSVHYLQIAAHGYQHARDAAFYPLYPLLIRVVSFLTGSLALAGVLISLTAMLATLAVVHRLTVLELGHRTADVTVRLIAFGPMALFLSAVYTESLFMALSAGTFYAARRGRWAAAGALGGLAAMSRSGGAVLLAPVLIMFFWGPRTDVAPVPATARWQPRYRLTPAVLWALLIPLGAALVALYFDARGFGLSGGVRAQLIYQHHALVLPVIGLWQGLAAGWHQVWLALHGTSLALQPRQALFQSAALLVSLVALVGVFRRLPFAYGIYTLLGVYALHLSSPTIGDPLAGFARYASLRFPLFMFVAAWAVERHRTRVVLIGSALLLGLFTAQFATWQVVGTPIL
jgi:hypothetical protein